MAHLPLQLDPFPNVSVLLLKHWAANTGLEKSERNIEELVSEVLLNNNFRLEDLRNVNWKKLNSKLDLLDAPTNTSAILAAESSGADAPIQGVARILVQVGQQVRA